MRDFFDIWHLLSKHRKRQSLGVILLMIISSISEVASIGSILPFLGVITSPDTVYHHEYAQPIVDFFGWQNSDEIVLPFTTIFIVAILVSSSIRILLIYVMLKLSYAIGADLSINMYRRTLYQSYATHVARNSSEIVSGVISKSALVTGGVVTPLLYLISSAFILTGILFILFYVDSSATLASIILFGSLYLLISLYTKKQLKINGKRISYESTRIVKALQEGLGNIRDVLLDNRQEYYCQLYKSADQPLRQASAVNSFISTGPRFLMEAIGVSLIAIIAYYISTENGKTEAVIPVLGAIAMGAQRLLPLFQQIYASISTLTGAKSSFNDVIDLLDQPLPNTYEFYKISENIKFKKSIRLNNVYFSYTDKTANILNDINITIHKGDVVGFVGETGSGKSTLVDIIMGLLSPTQGSLQVDDILITSKYLPQWQNIIAHVPQSIYLSDSTILENIAFGIPKCDIDFDKAILASKKASMFDTIQSMPKKFETIVGEQGMRLSGGQKQRIGIARALYKESELIIFDEATSALDDETERSVMQAIDNLDRNITVLIIAHRISTLKNCNRIFKLSKDSPISEVKYHDLEDNM